MSIKLCYHSIFIQRSLVANILRRSLDILKDYFQHKVLEEQDPWASTDTAEQLLRLLPDKALVESLRKKWEAAPGRSSSNKWADIDSLAKAGASKSLDGKVLLEATQDIVLEYAYPRLDVEVSKKQIHLLKSPFVIHPGTGRVCVPIETKHLTHFDQLSVPTVTSLLGEIDRYDSQELMQGTSGGKIQDYEKTSLKPYVEFFKIYVTRLLREERGTVKDHDSDETMEF